MTEMTSAQRLMMTAMGKEPDRVPVSGVANDWAWGQLYGKDSFMEYSTDPERSAEVIVWGCREMGSDTAGITADTLIMWEAIADASGFSPYSSIKWKDYIPTHPHRLYSGDPIKDPAYGDPLIKTMEDAKRLKPADPYKHGRLPYILKAAEIAIKELGDDYPVGGMADIPMHIGGCLMGWTQMFIAMDKDLMLWKTVEKVIIDSIWDWIKAQHKIGIRVFGAVSELPQKVGAEEYFKHPVWMQADHPPEIYKRAWEELKIPIGLHPCTVGPFEPGIPVWKTFLDHCFTFMMPECGGADALARAKEELAPATMIGNINPVDIMLHGTASEVEDGCVELIQKCGPGGRFILGTGCEIPLDTPYENVKMMVDSVRKYGRYPINI